MHTPFTTGFSNGFKVVNEHAIIPSNSELLREPNLLIPGKKPIGPVRIDWSNSITKGCICFVLSNVNKPVDLTGNTTLWTQGGTPTWEERIEPDKGIFVLSTGVSCSWIGNRSFDFGEMDAGGEFTLMSYTTQYATNYNTYTISLSAGAGSGIGVRNNQNHGYTPGNIYGTDITLNQPFLQATDAGNSLGRIWYNGKLEPTTTTNGAVYDGKTITLNAFGATSYSGSGALGSAFYAVWDRILSAEEHYSLYLDPYQFIIPA